MTKILFYLFPKRPKIEINSLNSPLNLDRDMAFEPIAELSLKKVGGGGVLHFVFNK